VDEEDFYQGGDALAPVANVDEMLARARGSVRSAMDNVIMPTMHTIFDRISQESVAPEAVEVEFGLETGWDPWRGVSLPRRRRDTSR